MLHIATVLWDANQRSLAFSRAYDESWVEKLYWGFRRNLTRPFRFVVFTDRHREFSVPKIEQRRLVSADPDYGCFTEPYCLDERMILVGLDTVIVGNIDHLAEYTMWAKTVALPRDPYQPRRACNGVALVPAGKRAIFDAWRGENDMEWIRQQPHVFIDDLFPDQVLSFKCHVAPRGMADARIIYFHGHPKMHELPGEGWLAQHWREGE